MAALFIYSGLQPDAVILLALFSENYDFFTFSEQSNPMTGVYVLEPIAGLLRFDEIEQHDIVAYPIEKKKFIMRRDAVR